MASLEKMPPAETNGRSQKLIDALVAASHIQIGALEEIVKRVYCAGDAHCLHCIASGALTRSTFIMREAIDAN